MSEVQKEIQVEEQKDKKWYGSTGIQILAAAVLSIGLALLLKAIFADIPPSVPRIIGIPGKLWLRSLQAVVVPLIFVSMLSAVQSMMHLKDGGAVKLVRTTVIYYVGTTVLAVLEGLIVSVAFMAPFLGRIDMEGLDEDIEQPAKRTVEEQVEGLFLSFIPANIVMAFAENEILAIIVVALTMGYLIVIPKESTVWKLVQEIEIMVIKIVTFLINWAPVGVFFLILSSVLNVDLAVLGGSTAILIGFGLLGIGFHFFIVYPIIYFAVVKKNPFAYMKGTMPAFVTAFGTSSSAATMPVTLTCAQELGNPSEVYQFTVPLGTTINMDGAAIYFTATVIFLAVVQGIALSFADYIIIVLLCTLTSIGATPVPSSGLVIIVLICEQVNIPVGPLLAVVIAVDFILDRACTSCNVGGDLFAAAVISKLVGIEHLTDEEPVLTEGKEIA